MQDHFGSDCIFTLFDQKPSFLKDLEENDKLDDDFEDMLPPNNKDKDKNSSSNSGKHTAKSSSSFEDDFEIL